MDRFLAELNAEYERVRELYESEMELRSPRRYYIEFDPEETKVLDVLNTLRAIRAREEGAMQGGRRRGDILTPVVCAALLEKPGWSVERLADWLGLGPKRVEEIVNEGRKFLTAGS
jgi:hypothetical protein